MRFFRSVSWLLAVLALTIASACGGSSGATSGGGRSPASSPTTDSGAATLNSIVLNAQDIGSDAVEQQVPKGRRVAGQVTLDLCGASFPSEAFRTARLQVAFVESLSHLAVSNEVVSYRAGGTRRAYAELKAAAASCPNTFRVPGATASNLRVESRDSRLVSRQLTVSALFAPTGSSPIWTTAVYQFEGDDFSGVYVYGGSRSRSVRLARRLAALSASRLHSELNGS